MNVRLQQIAGLPAVLLLCSALDPICVSAQSPPPATRADCASARPPAVSIVKAFSDPIDDARTREFIDLVSRAEAATRAATIARAKAATFPPDGEIATAIRRNCLQFTLESRSARFAYELRYRWHDNIAPLGQPAYAALGALLLERTQTDPAFDGPPVSTSARDAALGVFGIDVRALDALIADPSKPESRREHPQDTCNRPAQALVTSPPEYPQSARNANASGTFVVGVDLDDHGLIEDIALDKSATNAHDAALNDLIEASTYSAGVATYAPAFTNCTPHGAHYEYRTDFSSQ